MGDKRTKPDRAQKKQAEQGNRRRIAERRRKQRYKVRQGVFAAILNGSHRLGQIKDISLVGLSFRYIDSNRKRGAEGVLKILLAGGGLFMDDVPYKPVSDVEIESEVPLSSVRMRQMHIAFGDLSPQQLSLLDEFILNHTMGEA